MNRIQHLDAAIADIGLTQIAEKLSQATGRKFSIQQVNNWRTRGVPYRWQDELQIIAGLTKPQMRESEQ